jgi:hypothetical protein
VPVGRKLTQLSRQHLAQLILNVKHEYVLATLGEEPSRRCPHPARGSGDNRCPAGRIQRTPPIFSNSMADI